MSFSELQIYYLSPRLSKQAYLRGLQKSLGLHKKIIRAKARRAVSKTRLVSRRQYYITRALSDLKIASTHNEDIVIMSVASIIVLTVAAAATAGEILLSLSMTTVSLADMTGMSALGLMLLASVATAVLYGWFFAFLMNLLSVSVMEGATRKSIRSVRLTYKKSLHQASRIASSWFMILALIVVPLLVAVVITYLSIGLFQLNLIQLLTVLQYETIAAIIWLIYVLLQYSLVPCALLFESNQTLTSAFGRSRQLVNRKGRLFVLAAYVSLMVILLGVYSAAALIEQAVSLEKWLTFSLAALLTVLFFNGSMVMLYRKRRLARVH